MAKQSKEEREVFLAQIKADFDQRLARIASDPQQRGSRGDRPEQSHPPPLTPPTIGVFVDPGVLPRTPGVRSCADRALTRYAWV